MQVDEAPDFADPKQTLVLLQQLEAEFGMSLPLFRRLHHLPTSGNLSISGHRAYARRIARSRTGRFAGDDKNVATARRLAICLDGLRASLSWDAAIGLASAHAGPATEAGTRQCIRTMLVRIPIERAQRAMYKAVLKGPEHSFRQAEMEATLKFSRASFQGALNALSRRINDTPGLTTLRPGLEFIFDVVQQNDERVFVAKPALLEELRANSDLMEVLARDWDTVLDDDAFVGLLTESGGARLLDRCVYTILHRDRFADGLRARVLTFDERKPWVGAVSWLDEARREQRSLGVVFANAERTRDLIGWGVIDELIVQDGMTRVVVSQLRALTGRSQQELTVHSSGQPIAEGHIRPYVLCTTPEFVLHDVATAPPSPGERGQPIEVTASVESDPDAYELVQRRLRRHQNAFRESLLKAYDGRCAITGTSVDAVLEAAHIEPHVERGDNSAANGLLLRSDLHALFDEGLLRIHPTTLEVHLDASIADPTYAALHGRRLRARADGAQPSVTALEVRWTASRGSKGAL